MRVEKLICLFVFVASASICQGESAIFAPVSGYEANDILGSEYFSGYDVDGNNVVGWVDDWVNDIHSLKMCNKAGTQTTDLGGPGDYSYGWNNFVKLDPSGDSAWAGFSVFGNTDDRIYQVDLATGTWSYRATMAGNFELEFFGGEPYVSGLNSTNWSDPSSIWLLDVSGNNNHELIASIGGYSAGFAFDSSGNLYYATNGLSDNVLIRYTATQIADAVETGGLGFSDAALLSDIDGGAYDTDVDDADNVLFSANGTYSYTAIWDGAAGSGTNYELIGTGNGQWGNWFCFVDSQGDVSTGGSLYQSDYFFNGIAEICVPESALLMWSARNVEKAIASKKAAQKAIDKALVEERAAAKILNILRGSDELDGIRAGDIVKARRKIQSAIQHEIQSKNALRKSGNKLEDASDILTGEDGL